MKKCSKHINSLEQMYIIIGFAFFFFASVLVIDYLMSFSYLAFSISPLQKQAPCCANPHFKALSICWKQSTPNNLWQPLISPDLSLLKYNNIAVFARGNIGIEFNFVPERTILWNWFTTTPQIQHRTCAQKESSHFSPV